jgi:hypothetical protein
VTAQKFTLDYGRGWFPWSEGGTISDAALLATGRLDATLSNNRLWDLAPILPLFEALGFGLFHWPDLKPPPAAFVDLFDAGLSAHDDLWMICRDRDQAADLARAIHRAEPVSSARFIAALVRHDGFRDALEARPLDSVSGRGSAPPSLRAKRSNPVAPRAPRSRCPGSLRFARDDGGASAAEGIDRRLNEPSWQTGGAKGAVHWFVVRRPFPCRSISSRSRGPAGARRRP